MGLDHKTPIRYEEVLSGDGGTKILASTEFEGNQWACMGDDYVDARNKLLNALAGFKEVSPESFVVLPPPVSREDEDGLRRALINSAILIILFMVVVGGIAYLAKIMEDLTK